MAIVLKRGEINPIESDARYVKRCTKQYVQSQGHTYRVLSYVRSLTPCECFLRRLAWALSYITIIPVIFCRVRINRLLREARRKSETKTTYVAVDYQAKYADLKRQIEKINMKPTFIDTLLDRRFSLKNYSNLKKWLKARDTLIVWRAIAINVSIAVENLNTVEFPNIEATVEKAAKFAEWSFENSEKIEKIPNLNLDNNQLTSLPKEIGNLSRLRNLDLRGNQLTSLPKEMGNLTELECLYLNGNQLTSLPKEIGNFLHLKKLYIADNRLTDLPKEIGKLSKLKYLGLSGNQLTNLPKEIRNHSELKYLHLDKNRLTGLPVEICDLPRLESLTLSGNQLIDLPVEIGKLSRLNFLNLVGNKLIVLPSEIGRLPRLKHLLLQNNELEDLPEEIVNLKGLGCNIYR